MTKRTLERGKGGLREGGRKGGWVGGHDYFDVFEAPVE